MRCWLAAAHHRARVCGRLQEPFWPEGLGVNRGANNAQDSVWAVNQWGHARSEAERKRVVEERQALYEIFTKEMNGNNKAMLRGYNVQDNTRILSGANQQNIVYETTTVDPSTRYNLSYNTSKAPYTPLKLRQ